MSVLDSSAAVIDMDFGDIDGEDEARHKRSLEAEVERIESTITQFVRLEYEDSKGAMAEFHQRIDRYWKMFFNEFVPEKDDSPYKKINVPLLTRNVKLLHAHLSKATIPDKQKMDFFRAIPRRQGPALQTTPEGQMHAKNSEYAIQQNLVDGGFGIEYGMSLLDLLVSGNQVLLHVWEQDTELRETMVPNPDYDTVNPENNIIEAPDGTLTLKEAFIWDCEEVRTYDAPKSRYIDIRNVYPSELDKNNIKDCYGVSIYDTASIAELEENSIENGGLLYANLDKVKKSDERRDVSEIDDGYGSPGGTARIRTTHIGANVPKLRRITRFGRLDKEHLFPDQKVDPEAWAMFCEKFNIDQKKANYCKTWVVQLVNEQIAVRIQPLPYKKDEIPVTHNRFLVQPNRTLGEGSYKLDEWEERIYNFFRRKGIELTQKVVDPPIAFRADAFDQQWVAMHGRRFVYKPGMTVPMRNTNNVRDGWNPMAIDASPMQEIRAQMGQSNNNINSLTNLPPIKQGIAGEANSATDASIAAGSSDLFIDEVAESIETGCLAPTVNWHYSLEQQYRSEPQFVSRPDNNGRDIMQIEVPPDVWMNDYAISIVGRRTIGNKAIQLMNFKEAMTVWLDRNIINPREAFIRHMEMLEIPNAEGLYQDPPPEGPPEPKVSLTGKVDINELPPEHQQIMLQGAYPALAEATGGQLPMQHIHEFPGETVEGGGDNPDRNHHAPGEVEKRQRGLKDAEGAVRSASQQTRNPMGSRRAQ